MERQCVTFTGNSRMNPSKMDGYVYTGFRLVIVPWRRQNHDKNENYKSRHLENSHSIPLPPVLSKIAVSGKPIENRSRVDTRADRKSILLRNYVKMWNEKEHFDSVEGRGDFILDVFVRLFNFSFEIIGSFEKKKKRKTCWNICFREYYAYIFNETNW